MGFIRKKFLIVVLSIIGVLLLSFGLASLNGCAEKNISAPPKSAEIQMLEKIEVKLVGKYKIGTYSINTHVDNNSQDIDIDVLGSQEYYDSVKHEIKDVVRNLIKSTKFEEYNVNVKKGEIRQRITEEELERNNLLVEIAKKINNELSNAYPNKIDGGVDLRIPPPEAPQELIVEVSTLLDGEKQEALGREIERTIYTTLEKKLASNKLLKESTVKIYVYNKNKEKIKT
ncbi:hypothetical protein NXZ77_22150 [Lysinibacillus boronitolerans]|uniref:hypothetical protein n=1 Tax=Lysinibacillus boronitolerans TaxID=309788 RepID=UPI0021636925|nr:hypothetical protein [Lysinibacillus boronitolerans]MCS1394272.1 hypothetical protein [Lysinibacillus boronitolerans]